jgi:hypothetical protein
MNNETIPCINCICLAICKAHALRYVPPYDRRRLGKSRIVYIISTLCDKCSILKEYAVTGEPYQILSYNQCRKVLNYLTPYKELPNDNDIPKHIALY